MKYEVRYVPNAIKDLTGIEPGQAEWLVTKAEEVLSVNPSPHGNVVKQIKGSNPAFSRLRAGNWRIFFRIDHGIVWVLAVVAKPKADRVIMQLMR